MKLADKKKHLAHKMGTHGKGFMTYIGKKGKESLESTGKNEGEHMMASKGERNRA